EVLDGGVIARAVTVGDAPEYLTAIHVDRGDPAVRWLYQGKSLWTLDIPRGIVVANGVNDICGRICFHESVTRDGRDRHRVIDAVDGVESTRVPARGTVTRWNRQGSLITPLDIDRWGNKHWTVVVFLDLSDSLCMKLGSEFQQLGLRHA